MSIEERRETADCTMLSWIQIAIQEKEELERDE